MEWAAPPGKQVWVKVVDIRAGNDGRLRVGCSMKVVNQDDGADLVSPGVGRASATETPKAAAPPPARPEGSDPPDFCGGHLEVLGHQGIFRADPTPDGVGLTTRWAPPVVDRSLKPPREVLAYPPFSVWRTKIPTLTGGVATGAKNTAREGSRRPLPLRQAFPTGRGSASADWAGGRSATVLVGRP